MRVQSLHIYPVKAFHAIDITESAVETRGLAHDRRWMLVDANGKFISQREYPQLAQIKLRLTPEGMLLSAPGQENISVATPDKESPLSPVSLWKNSAAAHDAADDAHLWVSRFLGIPCKLVFQGDRPIPVSPDWGKPGDETSFSDGYPTLVTTTASLRDLNSRLEKPVPMNRFRSNIVIENDTPWAEDGWRSIRIGDVELEIVKPCTRCVVTTVDQETGEKTGDEPIATLKTFRLIRQPGLTGVVFGQNAIPRKRGVIRVGDVVERLKDPE